MTAVDKRSLLFILLLMIFGIETETGLAETNRWAAFGPVGGSVSVLAVDPQNPNTLYAASTGVFKSTDGGANWRRSSGPNAYVSSILIDPQNSSNLYATTYGGLFKSTDAGMSWNALSLRSASGSVIQQGVFQIAIDPQKPATIYAGHSDGCEGPGCPIPRGEGLFKSTDGGTTWQKTPLSSLNVYSVAVDPQQPKVLYVGTREGAYLSTDGGETWRRISTGYDFGGWHGSVAFDPQDTSNVYMGTASGLFKSMDRGRTWNPIWLFSYVLPIYRLLVDPHDPRILYTFTFDGTFKSTDAGASWSGVGPYLPSPLTWDPKSPGAIYATKYEIDESVLLKSTDGGASWRRLYSGLIGTTVSLAIDPQNQDSVYAITRYRLFKSMDGARRWQLLHSTSLEDDFFGVAIDPHNSQIIYASKRSGVYKSTNAGVNWNSANNGLPSESFVRGLHIDPKDSNTIYAPVAINKNGYFWNGLFKSTDGGARWTALESGGLPETRSILSFAVNPQKPQSLYVSYYHPTSPELYRSTDGGNSWTNVALPAVGPVTFMDITFDPQNSDTVYVVAKCGLFKSDNGGTNWTTITSSVGECVDFARVQPEKGSTLYAATQFGLFKTTDGGASWVVESGVPRAPISSFAIDRNSNRKYAAVVGGGVFATFDLPPQETPVPLLTLDSTGCIGQSWSLNVSAAQANAAVHLFGNSNGRTWEISEWSKTDAFGVYKERGTFAKESEGRHTLYVDVDGATSNDASFRVFDCSR